MSLEEEEMYVATPSRRDISICTFFFSFGVFHDIFRAKLPRRSAYVSAAGSVPITYSNTHPYTPRDGKNTRSHIGLFAIRKQ